MIRTYILSGLLMAGVSLSGCTLTPSSDGYDLLDPEYKAEKQDPVAVPVKEASDKPWIKASPKLPAPVVENKAPEKSAVKPVEKPIEKTEDKKTVTPPVPLVAKAEVPKDDVKPPAPPKEKAVPCENIISPPGARTPKKLQEAKREKLQSGDRLKITVFREKDLTAEYQVNDKGMISFPMIGETKAAGLTPPELKKVLTDSLSKGYLVKPDVNVDWLSDCNSK